MVNKDIISVKNGSTDLILGGSNEVKKEYLPKSKQSANTLFTFMNKLEYLQYILKTQHIYPRYCREDIRYLHLNGLNEIAFPMKCFCDIFINKLSEHMKLYGKYGIALSKDWGKENKIQPIHYINDTSFIINSIQNLYTYIQTKSDDNTNLTAMLKDVLYDRLRFIKPISGNMYRQDVLLTNLNFHDEHEWRYVLKVDDDNIYPYITDFTDLNSLSDDLMNYPQYALTFSSKDIKYIIVKNMSEREELIYFLMGKCPYTEKEKYLLISKILVFKELEADW